MNKAGMCGKSIKYVPSQAFPLCIDKLLTEMAAPWETHNRSPPPHPHPQPFLCVYIDRITKKMFAYFMRFQAKLHLSFGSLLTWKQLGALSSLCFAVLFSKSVFKTSPKLTSSCASEAHIHKVYSCTLNKCRISRGGFVLVTTWKPHECPGRCPGDGRKAEFYSCLSNLEWRIAVVSMKSATSIPICSSLNVRSQ